MQSPLRRRASKRCDNRRILETGYAAIDQRAMQVLKNGLEFKA